MCGFRTDWGEGRIVFGLAFSMGPFKCYVTPMGVRGVRFSGEKRYEGVRFNVISVTRGSVGSNSQEKSVT